jgi:hypothetical protein
LNTEEDEELNLCNFSSVTASAFYKEQNVVDFIGEQIDLSRLGRRPLQDWQWDKVYSELKGRFAI